MPDSRKQEKQLEKDLKHLGAKRNVASGAFDFKHDLRLDSWLLEAKITDQKGFRLSLKYWKDFIFLALKGGRLPVLVLEFPDEKIAMIRYDDWLALAELMENEQP